MRVFAIIAAALAIFTVSACGKSVSLPRLSGDAVVLAFGDSLTFGTGAREEESYPARLAEMIGRTVVRAGVPGEVSTSGLARLPAALDEHGPALLILCHGGNDFLRRQSKEKAAENLRAMVRLAQSRGVAVVLVGTPEPGFTVSPPAFYAEIAEEFGIPYEGGVIGRVLKDSALKSDPIHPNAEGYRVIAQSIAELLRKAGAV